MAQYSRHFLTDDCIIALLGMKDPYMITGMNVILSMMHGFWNHELFWFHVNQKIQQEPFNLVCESYNKEDGLRFC